MVYTTSVFWASVAMLKPYANSNLELDSEALSVANTTSNPEMPRQVPKPALNGFEISHLFKTCAKSNYSANHEDAIISQSYKFAYVDVVKAGSSTIRGKLGSVLHLSWKPENADFGKFNIEKCSGHRGRVTTKCANTKIFQNISVFSFVRDPVAKFESGVRQAKVQSKWLKDKNADDILEIVLNGPRGKWVNEHLEPSTFRLKTKSKDGDFLEYDFIGRLEFFDHDWKEVVARFDAPKHLRKRLTQKSKVENAKKRGGGSKLSEKGILKMCKSERYRYEWACFGYPLPEIC
eukprot:CAMPEP_0194400178 /NCGR_PEP_ID=MMETSP0174-20130528/127063_1 /TAXON_ID=216777 /ORGANISM="Proboscia alata, Strain PI-D3" /LENGTH=290 /DNA_ID=CAMNT_0039196653 /DNA_START=975 /DNA_END=1844 /DNA_ORIENTATION=+